MLNINISTMICKPVQQVFDFVSTSENDSQWQYGTLATARLSEGASSIGTIFRSIGHVMGRRNLSTFEVTEFDLDKKYSFKSLSGPLPSQTSYTFETANGCTKIDIATEANVVNFFQIPEGLVEKSLKKQLKENLALLKDLLEAEQASPFSETSSFTTRYTN